MAGVPTKFEVEKEIRSGKSNTIVTLVKELSSTSFKVQKEALRRLVTLVPSEPICDEVVKCGGIRPVLKLLEKLGTSAMKDKDFMVGVLVVAQFIIFNRSEFITHVFEKGDQLIRKLIRVLRYPGEEPIDYMIRQQALYIIAHIVSEAGKPEYNSKVLNLGIFEILQEFVERGDEPAQVLNVIYNLIIDSREGRVKLAKVGLIKEIVKFYKMGNEEVKHECLWIFNNIAEEGSDDLKCILVKEGIVKILEESLRCEYKDHEMTVFIEKMLPVLRVIEKKLSPPLNTRVATGVPVRPTGPGRSKTRPK